MSSKWMKADNLILFFIEEAEHWVINDKRTKYAESTLAAHGKKPKKEKFCADFARQMYWKCGMRVLIVVTFIDPDK